ncbi:MAG TPA: alpha-ribazole phosphatase [Mucilaginibacter sp.]|jgi:alpha-ribazole phosphatase
MEIYLIRHTAVYNPEKLCYGQSEISLSPDWEQHFKILKQKLGSQTDEAIFYSSPYKRCAQLAGFLSDNQFQTDSRLSEMHFGDWEQHAWTEVDQAVLNAWMADYVRYRVPGGENFEIMCERCSQFWDELIQQTVTKVAVITHAGVIRSILAYILNIPLDKIFRLEIDYSGVTKITVTKQNENFPLVNYINR